MFKIEENNGCRFLSWIKGFQKKTVSTYNSHIFSHYLLGPMTFVCMLHLLTYELWLDVYGQYLLAYFLYFYW